MNNFFKLLMLTIFAGSTLVTFGQNAAVQGRVTAGSKPLEAATIALLKAADSAVVKTLVTDKTGGYTFANVANGNYLVAATAVGFDKQFGGPITIQGGGTVAVATIALTAQAHTMQGVVVTSKKQFIEQKLDKTVLNVDASPTNANLTALEVLEKAPGVAVDKDGNIRLKGRQGVMVMMDGKPTYLSAADLANLLKNMPSNQLDQIEIMSNPPAKYDAAGNSGIINIKTKKNKTQGLNGSVSLGAGYSVVPKSNNSLNLNYRTGKFNVFTNLSQNWYKGRQNLTLTRRFPDTTFLQHADMTPRYQTYSAKVGVDYYLSKNTTLGVVLSGFENPGTFTTLNTTQKLDNSGNLLTRTETFNKNTDRWQNRAYNFNMRHVFDSTGRELTADVDYIRYNADNAQYFANYFYDRTGNKNYFDEFLNSQLPSVINIYSGKADYTHPLKGNAKLEAGFKTSFVNTDNDARYYNLSNDTWVLDGGKSNHFKYQENINAVYVNVSKELNQKWSAQLGLRVENTNAQGNQVTTGEVFERNYTQFFPTAYASYKMSEKNTFALSYGRRIDRPNYRDMNPFYFFLDKYTYQVGNPYLRPQFSQNVELSHSFKGFLNTSLAYSKTTDIIQQVLEQIDSISTSYVKQGNLASQQGLSLSVSANMPVTKWWRTNIYTNVFYNRYQGTVNNGPIEVAGTTGMANVTNNFTFKKGWGAELSGFYRTREVEGVMISRSMGGLNVGVSKQVLNNKGSIRFNVRDVLLTQQFRGYTKYQNIDVTIHNRRDSRVFNIGFTYRFGKQLNTPQRKKGGAGDEQNRVKTGN